MTMRILVVHNYYQQAGWGDELFRAEVDLLRDQMLMTIYDRARSAALA